MSGLVPLIGTKANKIIPDSAFTASNFWDYKGLNVPSEARMDAQQGWCRARGLALGEDCWLQVDLQEPKEVHRIQMRGCGQSGYDTCYVAKFSVSHSDNGTTWARVPGAFEGNKRGGRDGDLREVDLTPALTARFVRIHVLEKGRDGPILRLELLGRAASEAVPVQSDPILNSPEAPAASPEQAEAAAAVAEALAKANNGGCVRWNRGRLMVLGAGGAGKTCTIRALSGETFDSKQASTPGTATQDVELGAAVMQLAGSVSPMKKHETQEGGDLTAALAGLAVDLKAQQAAPEAPAGSSGSPSAGAPPPNPSAAGTLHGGPGAAITAPTQPSSMLEDIPREAPQGASAAGAAPAASGPATPMVQQTKDLGVKEELLIRYAHAKKTSGENLVVCIFDCGGQDVFSSIHEIFHSGMSAYMVVFSLADLNHPLKQQTTMNKVISYLNGIFLHCGKEGTQIILVGTKKEEAVGDDTGALKTLSDILHTKLSESCPGFSSVVFNKGDGDETTFCFYPVENSKGFEGDPAIRALAGAIEGAIRRLPSLQKTVPVRWLKVFDELRAQTIHQTNMDEVHRIAERCGLPHDGLTLQAEVAHMLKFFHGLGAVVWFDLPQVREMVVLNPQWILDAVTAVIRTYTNQLHKGPYDDVAIREQESAWKNLTEGMGLLDPILLTYLWKDPQYGSLHDKLLRLMVYFGLVVPVRGRHTLLVPALVGPKAERTHAQASSIAGKVHVHFSLGSGSDAPADEKIIWSADDMRRGFLPQGVFHQLAAACVGHCNHTAIGFDPTLTPTSLHVAFGSDEFELRRSPGTHYISLHLLTDASGALAVFERVEILVAQVLEAHYGNLKVTYLIPLPGSDQDFINRTSLRDLKASQVVKAAGKLWTEEDLKKALAVWLPPRELPPFFHGFVSYRWGPFDSPFVDRLVACLSSKQVEGQRILVFQDKRRLEQGSQFDMAFMEAMSKSLVVVPVFSWGAMQRMTTLKEDSSCDNVLLEWSLALELHHRLQLQVVPLLIGEEKEDQDGSKRMTNFFAELPEDKQDGQLVTPPRSVFDRIPKVVVDTVVQRLEEFASKQGWVLSDAARSRTANQTVIEMSKFLGMQVWDMCKKPDATKQGIWMGEAFGYHDEIANQVADIIKREMGRRPALLPAPAPATTEHQPLPDGVLKQGPLKRLIRGDHFERCYCVLRAEMCRFYKESDCKEETFSVKLHKGTQVVEFETFADAAKYRSTRPHGLVLDPNPFAGKDRRLIYLDVGTAEDQLGWAQAFEWATQLLSDRRRTLDTRGSASLLAFQARQRAATAPGASAPEPGDEVANADQDHPSRVAPLPNTTEDTGSRVHTRTADLEERTTLALELLAQQQDRLATAIEGMARQQERQNDLLASLVAAVQALALSRTS